MSIVEKLLAWYRNEGRKLPWRETTDPYRILVSEIMLQQTQVSRVLEFYVRWLDLFPDWNALSKASNAEVIEAWAGLGYNRRALMLRDIARQIAENGVPESEAEWRSLKGIGPYTAAALTVFSLRTRSMPIDTNIRRVVGRVFLGQTYPQPENDKLIYEKGIDELMKSEEFYDVPQALFDLATTHCGKIPNCAECPLKEDCLSAELFLSGNVEPPKRMIKKGKERIHRNKKHPDRIYRGKILKLIRERIAIEMDLIGSEIDHSFDESEDSDWLMGMINRLIKDGFVERKEGTLVISSK